LRLNNRTSKLNQFQTWLLFTYIQFHHKQVDSRKTLTKANEES
jgi:hypothetical protein